MEELVEEKVEEKVVGKTLRLVFRFPEGERGVTLFENEHTSAEGFRYPSLNYILQASPEDKDRRLREVASIVHQELIKVLGRKGVA